MFLTLEQELMARIFMHKVAICKGVITKEYIDREKNKEGAVLPDVFLEEEAMTHANRVVQDAVSKGNLDELYNNIWDNNVKRIPDNFGIMLDHGI